jgi:glycosyltransferase involved in cell wall biosynthesis
MLIFALYPGASGNYLSILFENVYGLSIQPFSNKNIDFKVNSSVIITSHLPTALPDDLFTWKIVYVVRDGRDCVSTMAHIKKNFIAYNYSSYEENLREAITSKHENFYGGWSNHVESWCEKASLIIRFEDLIDHPIKQLERIREFVDLPSPDLNKLIPFDRLMHEDYLFDEETNNKRKDNYTIPALSGWEDDLPDFYKELFYKYHYKTLVKLGYCKVDEFKSLDLSIYYPSIFKKMGHAINHNQKVYKILIEVSKLQMPYNDGIKRYVLELVKEIKELAQNNPKWQIDLYDGERTFPIREVQLKKYIDKLKGNIPVKNKIKHHVVLIVKNLLRLVLTVNTYQRVGLLYKLAKMKIRFSWPMRVLENAVNFIRTMIFFQKKPKLKFQTIFDPSDYDLVHIPLLQHVEFIAKAKDKVLMTLHDLTHLSHPQFHIKENIILADQGLKLCIEYNVHFFAISENTRKDFLQRYASPKEIPVIYEAADNSRFYVDKNSYWANYIRTTYGIPEDGVFLLSVSTLEPRKNLKNTIKAFQNVIQELPDNVYLIVAGKVGWKLDEVLPESIQLSPRVIFIGFVKEEHLPWFYREASALIYISYYEGFGLPILESMSCATPVIYGRNSSMIEIAANTGYSVDSDNIEEIGLAIKQVFLKPDEREVKSLQAFKRSNRFTWQKTAVLTMELYRKIIESKKTSDISPDISSYELIEQI